MKNYIIAVDFDGTLFTDEYPYIGKPIWSVINFCKKARQEGDTLILWTCRCGDDLKEAVEACKDVGLEFDYVNENSKEHMAKFNNQDTRKIYADVYIDDKMVDVKIIRSKYFE